MQLYQFGKRLCGMMTAMCLMLSATEFTHAKAKVKPGDCNADGSVDAADVTLLQTYLCGNACDLNTAYADYNADGVLDVRDLTLLKYEILNPKVPESATLLVYQCGSDLESEAMEATVDLDEMIRAVRSDKLKIVVETGGAKKWHQEYSDAKANYRITIRKSGVSSEKISERPKNMGAKNTLRDFIVESVKKNPADRYGLVIWDHGAGPIYGCCYDELADDLLTISELCGALEESQVYFDFIGFDCCLMGSAEVAYAVRDYADYMVASEETESGFGWYYRDFLTEWGRNIAIPTETLVKKIVDDMIGYNTRMAVPLPSVLSAYDLSHADELMEAIYLYIYDVVDIAKQRGPGAVYQIRTQALDFGEEEYDLVDLEDIVTRLETPNSDAVLKALDDMVIHKRSMLMEDECGVNLWFYEKYPEDYLLMEQMYLSIGISKDYTDAIKKMVLDYIRTTRSQASVQSVKTREDPWFSILWEQYRNGT